MRVYLVQHGEAVSKEENPDRPLSEKGAGDVREVGNFLYQHARLLIPEILHSGKLRAAETANLLARCLNAAYDAGPDLQPNDDPERWFEHLTARNKDVMLVGHLPHLEHLASLLLCGDVDRRVVTFQNAGVVCLERDEENDWHLNWVFTPDLLASK
jgi:phosphohistidine phosphatase